MVETLARPESLSTRQLKLFELLKKRQAVAGPRTSIPRRNEADPLVLSFGQKRLWFIEQLQPGNAGYNVPGAVRIRGPLDMPVLQRCLGETGRRHEILRTSFHVVDGEPVPVIAAEPGLRLVVTDLRNVPAAEREAEAARVIDEEVVLPFGMTRAPLARTCLLRLGDEEHIFLLVLQHIICDIWSVGVFFRTMMALYDACVLGRPAALAEMPIQYTDYAVWQQKLLRGEGLESLLSYWKAQVAGAPFVIELPVDHPRPLMQSFLGGRCYMNLGVERTEALKALGKQRDASLYMVLLSALDALLFRHTGQESILVGVPMANRNRLELEGLIGLLFNALVLRADQTGRTSFWELLEQVRERTLGAFNHQDLPFERLVEDLRVERDMGRNPVFQVLFAFQNVPPSVMAAHGLSLCRYEVMETTSREDLELDMRETPDGLAGWFGYDAALFDRTTVLRTTVHFQNLLDGVIRNPDRPLIDLPLLGEGEMQAVLREWNDTAAGDRAGDASLAELFAAQVERTPDAPAVICEGASLDYRALASRARALAGRLVELGVRPGVVVALLDRRGLDFLVAVLAVLEAGAAYLPLDPEHPPLRHTQVLGQSGSPLAIAAEEFLPALALAVEALPEGDRPRVLTLAVPLRGEGKGDAVAERSGPTDLVYVIFTSGSTGLPKGAMIEQRGMINHLRAKIESLALTAADTVAQTASQCFDISVWQLLAALLVGGRVQIYPDEVAHEPAKLLERAEADGITVLQTVPSLLRLMLEEAGRRGGSRPALAALRWMILTGEALPPDVSRQWLAEFPRVPLLNAYGPTECSDDVTHFVCGLPSAGEVARVPIGRPIRDTRLYVVDPELRPLPIGVTGELCVGGDGVGRGYLNAPERTAGVFVPDPLSGRPGARLYRTGDRVRRLADGSLDFLGRFDHQVKVRGFRIELGEIEAVLSRHPGVWQSVVLAQEAGPSERALVAYVVSGLEPDAAEQELRGFLKERLPEYMVPAGFVFLDDLPLTPNGKIDRRALLANGGARFGAGEDYVAPRNPVEDSLAAIWAQVLKVERVGVYDDFFALGGQSLLATQVISRIREVFAVELPVRALFQKPTIAGLAEGIEVAMLRGRGLPEALPMVRVPRGGWLDPSFGQERFWFIDQFRPGLTAYNIFGAVRMRGPLDLATLERSFDELLRRHEVLRTTFAVADGRPMQVIHPPYRMQVPLIDLSALPEALRFDLARGLDNQEAQQPFDLAAGPLIRAQLTRVSAGDHLLAVTAHHVVYDVWSRELLIRELGVLYEAFWHGRPSPLPELPIQYADFAAWQRQWLQGEVLATQLTYWKRQLAGVTSGTELPGDRPRPPVQSFRGARVIASISAGLTTDLKELSKKQGVTLFMTLLAGFQIFLYRYTHEEDVVVGSPIANRNRAETEGLIGFFVNTQVMRTDLSGRPTFRQLMARTREVALGAYAHQDLSFEQLVTEMLASRDTARQPIFQILFNFLTNYKPIEMELPPALLLTPEPNHSGAVQFDLVFSIYEAEGALHFSADYSTDLYERATMERLVSHYSDLLASAAAAPDTVFSELPFGSEEEWRQVLVDWNDTVAAVPWDSSVQTLFESWAERTPEAVAAVCEDRRETYAGLNRRANTLARRLNELGVGPDRVVALLADRGIDFLVAILGIFKSGGAYLPLDVRHPAGRLRQVVRQSGTRLVLVASAFASGLGEALMAQLGEGTVRLRALDELLEPAEREENSPAVAQPDSLAYVIYTSGSTGIPKGAMITHRNMLNHLFVKIGDLGLSAGDCVAQTASHTFDISVWQFLAALLVGGRVHIFKDVIAHDPPRLLAEAAGHGVTVLETVPSLMRLMLNEPAHQEEPPELTRLRWLIPTGEALPPDLCRRWLAAYPHVPLVNAYGPTECADDVTHHVLLTPPPADLVHVPIGRPVGNTRLYVLSPDLLPVPQGVAGELCVGGAGVGRGYLNDPARTAAVFIPDPFADHPGARLYRTQDLVRLTPGGVLEFHGRIDHQVKIRGFRIELGEIESVLACHPEVEDAVVLARESDMGEKRLVGYVVPRRAEAEVEPRLAAAKVGEWRAVFDQVYGHGAVSAHDSGINLRVWVSSYTGQPLPENEIVECFEDTVKRILAMRPSHLLEIGCGTGLLLNRIAPHCASYLATDLSGEVLRDVSRRSREAGLGHVTFLEQAADDSAGIPPATFDVVVLNEVVQYFPSVDYLVKVLEGALAAVKPGGVLFVGGVRSLPLLALFAASVQRFQAPSSMEVAELRRRIGGQLASEKELAVDPRLFLDLASRLPAVGGVWFQLKGGRHHNELTKFRYDVILRVGGRPEESPAPSTLSWREGEHSLDFLRRHLEEMRPGALRISGIPNARVREDLLAMELIEVDGGPATVAELGRALEVDGGGVDPADLSDLGEELGYQVFVSWAASGEDGRIDAVFARPGADPLPAAAASAPLPERAADRSWSRYGNDLLRREAADGLIPRLRVFLAERLPDYMVPEVMVLLDALPLTPNGKVDRRSLPAPDGGRPDLAAGYVPPGSPMEETLVGIWSQLLGVAKIGIHDNFFDLGGHSLMTTQLVSRLRGAFQIEVPLPTFFEDPTVAGLVQVIELARWAEQVAQEDPAVAAGDAYEEGEI